VEKEKENRAKKKATNTFIESGKREKGEQSNYATKLAENKGDETITPRKTRTLE